MRGESRGLDSPNLGPAPRLDAYQIVSSWQRPNICTPFNVITGPALAVCNGFTRRGFEKSEETYSVSRTPAWNGQRGAMEYRVDQRDKGQR